MSNKQSSRQLRRLRFESLEKRELLAVTSRIVEVVPDPRNAPVSQIDVVFSEAIDPATFTRADLRLRRNGGDNRINADVSIAQISPARYRVTRLTPLTQAPGNYLFTVNAAGVTDRQGDRGTGVATESWAMDLTPPRVLNVVNVSPDPRSGSGKAVRSVTVVLSEQVSRFSFDYRDIKLTRDGGPNLINSDVSVKYVSGRTYQVFGLAPLTNAGGQYRLEVSAENIRDRAGNSGVGIAVDQWLANDPPRVALAGTLVYAEQSRPIAIAGAGVVSDPDTPAFINGKLIVSIVQGARSRDLLRIFNRPEVPGSVGIRQRQITFEDQVIGTFSGGSGTAPLVVRFNGNATQEAATALLRGINFSSRGEYFRQETRLVEFVLFDGEGAISRSTFKSILIIPVNDPPTLRIPQPTIGYRLNRPGVLLAPLAVVADVDSPSFARGTLLVQFAGGEDNTERLDIGRAFSVVGNEVQLNGVSIGQLSSRGQRGAPLLVRFNENATRAIVQQLCRSISLRTEGSLSQTDRRVEFVVRDDQGGASNAVEVNVNVAP